MPQNTSGGPLGDGCPHNVDDCSPAYLCLGCCHDLASGAYADRPEFGPDLDLDVDAPTYEWECAGTITCDPLLDEHGRECDRINDEARAEFYADVLRSTTVGDLIGGQS